jgi:copper oxidase (laccase) domain-containing protein
VPGTASTTSWGTPALDLPAGVEAVLAAAGVARVERLGACTLTDPRWYSHRAHLASGRPAGRFAGVVALGGAVASVSHRPGRGSGLA